MKTIFTVIGIVLLIGFFAYPALSNGHGWGRGGHMMGSWDGDRGYGPMNDRAYGNRNDAQRSKMEGLNEKYYRETEEIRNRIMDKSGELDALLENGSSDPEKIRAVHRELSKLRAHLEQKELDYELEAGKIVPENRFGRGYGPGYQRNNWDRGAGMGYGPGTCWR